VPQWALKSVDQLFRDLTGVDVPFGGKAIVVGGDFRQVLPVIRGGTKVDVLNAAAKNFQNWRKFKKYPLTVNERTQVPEFREFLMQIGNGELGVQFVPGEKTIVLPEQYMSPHHTLDDISQFVNSIYNEDILRNPDQHLVSADELASAAILATTNEQVAKLNVSILEKMTSYGRTFQSHNSLIADRPEQQNMYSAEHMQAVNPPGVPPHDLKLKEGCVVMLLRNWSIEDGLTNGTRLRVTKLRYQAGAVQNPFGHLLECQVITSNGSPGRTVYIPKMAFVVDTEASGLDYNFKRVQFPICLAFAMTIHKSQGQTFDRVGIYLEHPVFTHGQLYVAMSRCRNPENFKIFKLCDSNELLARRTTANIVWPEVLFDEIPTEAERLLQENSDDIYDDIPAVGANAMDIDANRRNFVVPEGNNNLRRRIE
jgi:ATP-dependent DNA helicase PIF1